VSRRLRPTFIAFGLLGGLLLLNLVAPIVNLLFHADWSRWVASLSQPEAPQFVARGSQLWDATK